MHPAHRLIPVALAAALVSTLCAACATTNAPTSEAGTPPPETPQPIAAWIGAIRPIAAPVALDDLWTHRAPDRAFQYTLNEASRPVIHRSEDDPRGAEVVSWIDADSGQTLSSQRLIITDAGTLASAASRNPDRGVESRFRPPLLILTPTMAPGQPASQEVEVLVADAKRPEKVKHRGAATNTIEVLGECVIDAAGGRARCIVVRSTFEATFGPARVRRIAHRWYAPGEGLIAEHAHEHVRTFGIETENRHETWIATE